MLESLLASIMVYLLLSFSIMRLIIINRASKQQKKEPLEFDIKLSSDDLVGLNESDLDLSAAVELLGIEDDDEKKHPLVNHGTFLAYISLRHLRIRDLQRSVCYVILLSNLSIALICVCLTI